MGLIVVVFALRYYWSYQSDVRTELLAETGVLMSCFAFNGVLSGIFIGRCTPTLRVYREPFVMASSFTPLSGRPLVHRLRR